MSLIKAHILCDLLIDEVTVSMTNSNQTIELDGIGTEASDIRHLFTYNLQRFSSISSRIAVRYMLDGFDLTVQEWRALAVLHFLKAAPLILLAQRAGIQKSQASRLITSLVKRDYITRKSHPADGRSTLLSLTEQGNELVRLILEESRDRNRQMLQDLDDDERRELMRLMGKALRSSSRYLEQLKTQASDDHEAPSEPISFFEDS